ncbi:hypothetical protein ACSBR2_022228 [Camellia fascicularis]
MAVLSVTSTHSHYSLFLSPPPPPPPPPPYSSPKIYGCLSFSTILIPLPTLKPSSFSQRFSINGNWDSRRNRFRANSSDPERDFQNPPTQISRENDEISQDSSSSNPSTSLLSVLCPLLKIFSVSVSSSSPILFSSRFVLTLPGFLLLFLFFKRRKRKKIAIEYRVLVLIYLQSCCVGGLLDLFDTVLVFFPLFVCVLVCFLQGGDPSKNRNFFLEVATSSLSTLARLPWGSRSLSDSSDSQEISTVDPLKRLQLFEFEACPFCRRVREAITELDLSVEIYPCPKGSIRHREMVRRLGGKEQFPFLVDPNTGKSMYESSEIVKYLFQQYGKGRSPSMGLLESTLLTGWVPTILRAGRGMTLWEKAKTESPSKKLELFSYENNPYARIVREALCELELPYILQTVGEGSRRTNLLLEASGSKEVPYIIDPNTGTQIGDYKKILSYLVQTYSMVSA